MRNGLATTNATCPSEEANLYTLDLVVGAKSNGARLTL